MLVLLSSYRKGCNGMFEIKIVQYYAIVKIKVTWISFPMIVIMLANNFGIG